MRLLIQRAKNGAVHIDGQPVASIDHGLVVLVGFGSDDPLELPDQKVWDIMIQKMLGLRIFSDEQGKMNLSLQDTGYDLLLVPQFTLYASCKKGRRPSFTAACPPATATALFDALVAECEKKLSKQVQRGVFGADMDVSLTNWGPVTIMLDSSDFT